MHTCFQVTPYASYIELCEQLNKLAPGPTPKKSMLFSTGAEAIENALKIARYHTKRSGVIAFSGSFHGRTLAAMTLTGKVQPYKAGFGPMMPSVFHAPFPMSYHGVSVADSLDAIEQLFKSDIDPAAGGGHHHRAGAGRRRLLHRAAGIPARAARAVRPARHRADHR